MAVATDVRGDTPRHDGNSRRSSPGSYKVQVANDNVSWGTAPNIATGPRCRGHNNLLPAPDRALHPDQFWLPGTTGASWSIHEFNVYDTTAVADGVDGARRPSTTTNAGLAIDATAATRWNTVVGTNSTPR